MGPRHDTATRYGSITKGFHWITALLILALIPLGIIAENLAHGIETGAVAADQATVSRATFLFSVHKTLGVAVFFVALLRIVWALTQDRPGLINGDKPLEAFAASTVHWLLYGSLVLVPLSGWVHHAATTGFAPIWWSFGQSLPFVPKDETWSEVASVLHYLFQWVLIAALALHIAGALKHHVIDRDATLRRMLPGTTEGQPTARQPGHAAPFFGALAVWATVLGGAATLGWFPVAAHHAAPTTTLSAEGGNWAVQDGTLSISVLQMGAGITGSFADWQAQIQYSETADDAGKHGEVVVEIDTGSLTMGTVTAQATGAGYLESATHPKATFAADILRDDRGLRAAGTLTIREISVPVEMPFELTITDGQAQASGGLEVDRRDFNIGQDVGDEGSLGFGVGIDFALSAQSR